MHQRTLEIGLFAASLFAYLTLVWAIVAAGVRGARVRGEQISLFKLWLAGVVTAYSTAFLVALSLETLL